MRFTTASDYEVYYCHGAACVRLFAPDYKRKLCWVVTMEQGPEAGLERLIKMLVCLGRMPVFVNRHRPVHWQ